MGVDDRPRWRWRGLVQIGQLLAVETDRAGEEVLLGALLGQPGGTPPVDDPRPGRQPGVAVVLGHTLIIADIERRHAATLGESAYAQLRRALMTITDPGGA